MKQQKLLWIAVILLFLLNAGTLFFLFSARGKNRPEHRPGGNPEFDGKVISTLQLTTAQQQQFNAMKRSHHQQMMQLDDDMKAPFEQYFALLQQPAADPQLKDSLEKVIAGIYRQKVQFTYDHFQELKNSCTPQQQARFTALIPGLTQVIAPRPPRDHPGPPPPAEQP